VFDYRRGFRRLVLSQPKSGNDKSPLRGLYGISVCSPWGKKSQSAAVIPSGAPSAWMALLSEYFEGGQLQPDGPEHPHSVLAVPYILAVPHISSYFSPCAALVDTLLSIFRHGSIYHHTVWDHRLSQGLGPSTCVRFGTIGYRRYSLFQIANTPRKDKGFIISVLQIGSV